MVSQNGRTAEIVGDKLTGRRLWVMRILAARIVVGITQPGSKAKISSFPWNGPGGIKSQQEARRRAKA